MIAVSISKRAYYSKLLLWSMVAIGILLRITVFLQNRNLIIDEANIVRNLNERTFSELLRPLSYDQYAPPVFLFISKCNMQFWGAYEWAFRLFPLICSIANLFLLVILFKKLDLKTAWFYPLFLFAFGLIYVRYSTEFKQYSSDITVSLGLILLALKTDLFRSSGLKFTLSWLFFGSLAIWLSMPSVFLLCSVGVYYFFQALQRKKLILLAPFTIVAIIWLLQFLLYYFLLLKPSTENDYLQQSHFPYVFILPPQSAADWQHNFDAIATFFALLGGHWALNFAFHILLITIGIVQFWCKDRIILSLTLLPFCLLLLAVCFHQFTLLPRVCLFIYPILLLLAGKGLEYLFTFSYSKYAIFPCLIVCAISMINFNELNWLRNPPKFDRTTEGFEWIEQRNISGNACFIHDLVRPQKIYYTSIHPDSTRWAAFKNCPVFNGATNMDSLCTTVNNHQEVAFMFWWLEQGEYENHQKTVQLYFTLTDSLIHKDLYTFSARRKEAE